MKTAKRILNVDDDPAARYATTRTLQEAGFTVLEARNGQEALQLAWQELPDLVLLEVQLPDLNGFEVCRRLKVDRRSAAIPVVHLSATYVDLKHRVEGLERGADGYLVQPVEPPELIATVSAFLRLKEAEQALREREEKYRSLVDQTMEMLFLHDLEGNFLEVNNMAIKRTGYSEKELLGMNVFDLHPGQSTREQIIARWQGWAVGEPVIIEAEHRAKDGTVYPVEISTGKVMIGGREVMLALVRDITERRRTEAELRRRERERHLHQFLKNFQGIAYQVALPGSGEARDGPGVAPVPFPAEVREKNGTVPHTQKNFFYGQVEALTGYEEKELINDHIAWSRLVHPTDLERVRLEAEKLWTRPGYVADNEYRIVQRDGSVRWVRDIATRQQDPSGSGDDCIQGTLYEITAQKEAELALQETMNKLDALLTNSPNAISIFDQEGKYVVVSAATARIIGLPPQAVRGKTFAELLSPTVADNFVQTIAELQQKQQPITKLDMIPVAGGHKFYETCIFPVQYRGDLIELFGAVSIDVTRRIESEKALMESENRFRQLAEHIGEVFWLVSADVGELLYVNPAYEEIWGRPRDELYRDFATLLQTIHKDDRAVYAAALEQMCAGRSVNYEHRIIRPDGRKRWIHSRFFPVTDGQGITMRHAGTSIDITELKQSRDVALQASRAKSEFLAKVSHELRTPLHAINSYSELGLEESGEQGSTELEDYFRRINESGNRFLSLINDLIDVSRAEAGDLAYEMLPGELAELISSSREELSSILNEKNISLVMEKPPFSILVRMDRARLLQVLHNLVHNSNKFSPFGSVVRISFELLHDPVPVVAVHVVDEGCGIPEADLSDIFEKFKQSGDPESKRQGTGLGLSICREIIQAHGGTIFAQNEPQQGTRITFTLPLLEGG